MFHWLTKTLDDVMNEMISSGKRECIRQEILSLALHKGIRITIIVVQFLPPRRPPLTIGKPTWQMQVHGGPLQPKVRELNFNTHVASVAMVFGKVPKKVWNVPRLSAHLVTSASRFVL